MEAVEMELMNKVLEQASYYPEKKRKDYETRKKDLLNWYDNYNEVNEYYNILGLDCEDCAPFDIYLDHGVFRKQRYAVNSSFLCTGDTFATNYTAVMRDKMLFEAFAAGVLNDERKYVKSYAFLKGAQFLSREGSYEERATDTLEKFIARHEGEKLILKRTTGCSGKNVYVVTFKNGSVVSKTVCGIDEFLDDIMKPASTWMIQPFVKQHPFMAALSKEAVNIIRIVTLHTGRRCFTLPATLVYARKGTEVCNSDQGSYYVGIDEEGIINFKAVDWELGKFSDCPVGGDRIPFYKEICRLVTTLHKSIPELFTVGWDVALTDEGPLVFEGNDGWCPYVNQISQATALRHVWNEALKEREEWFKA